MPPEQDERRAELAAALGALRSRIARAADAAGRSTDEITLIAVTKTYPAADVAALAALGVRDVGESKDQEARAKLDELADDLGSADLRWHVIGQVQSNKARSIAGYAHAVHSLDRAKLVRALADGVAAHERPEPLDVFVQVSLDGDAARGGVPADGLAALTDAVADRPQLRLRGLMAVPPIDAEPDAAFARLAELAASVRTDHPGADALSAGMTGDLEAAIRHGSTHVRVGTALLGRRQQVFS